MREVGKDDLLQHLSLLVYFFRLYKDLRDRGCLPTSC